MFGIIVGGRRDIARWRRRYAWWTSCRNCWNTASCSGVDAEREDAMSVVRLKESNIGDENTAVGRYMVIGRNFKNLLQIQSSDKHEAQFRWRFLRRRSFTTMSWSACVDGLAWMQLWGYEVYFTNPALLYKRCKSANPRTCFLILDTRIWRPEKDEIQSQMTGRLSAMPRTEPWLDWNLAGGNISGQKVQIGCRSPRTPGPVPSL